MRQEVSKVPLENSNLVRRGPGNQAVPNQVNETVLSAANAGHVGISYYLTSHVFACATRHGVVLLDLLRNKYLGLDLTDGASLADVVRNWPVQRINGQNAVAAALDRSRMNKLVRSLLDANVLQPFPPPDCGIRRSTFSLEGDLASVGDEIIARAPVRSTHIVSFLFSPLCALFSIRFLPLSFTVGVVYKRKARAIARGYCFDAHRAAQLTFVFRRLRPYLFSAHGHCIIHALALVNFMALYGEFPSWVLGVRTDPWGAHSWVQHENLLFDTNPAKVCPYDPLLSV
jgi:hypothetical protein